MSIGVQTTKATGKVTICCICSKCSQKSRSHKVPITEEQVVAKAEEKGWTKKLEPELTPTGRIKRPCVHIEKHYCKKCSKKNGC